MDQIMVPALSFPFLKRKDDRSAKPFYFLLTELRPHPGIQGVSDSVSRFHSRRPAGVLFTIPKMDEARALTMHHHSEVDAPSESTQQPRSCCSMS